MFPYAPPGPTPFQSDKLNSEKSPTRKGGRNFYSYTNMANTTLVFFSVSDVNAMPTAVDTTSRSTVRSASKQSFLVQNRKLAA